MTLVVEDGAGLENANSYVTVQEADDHISLFYPDSDWSTFTTEQKEAYLIRAAKFLDSMMVWESQIKNIKQSMAWPRLEFLDREGRVVSADSVPQVIKEAQIDLAVESITNSLTTEYDKLISEKFGDTTDTYAAPVSRGGSVAVRNLIKSLSFMGYGRNRSSIITLKRA